MKKIKSGIIGGAGYTGGELIRILLGHPRVELCFVQSRSHAGDLLSHVHTDLLGETKMKFAADWHEQVDILFLCLAHGDSVIFLKENQPKSRIKIIDLSQDFRVGEDTGFIYGLPELYRSEIAAAERIANPGCFATTILLALLPLAGQHLIENDIHISAITGSTGAGQKQTPTTHFNWRSNNISVYKAFRHQHLNEIIYHLSKLQKGKEKAIHFLPFRGSFTRGILAACYLKSELSQDEAIRLYQNYYQDHYFVTISERNPDVKQVVNTNKAILYLEKNHDQLMIISVIDNLLKGAAGQAVQNLNLMFKLEEWTGLQFKASAF
jgi:N-acetyl-gamma-glutamyl-phosphate reductase